MANGADAVRNPFKFDLTVTLGTVLHMLATAILLIVAWVHITDRLQVLEDYRTRQEILFEKQSELLQSMQLNQAQQTVIIQNLERRLNIVEDVNGLDGKKR
jgi:hypothetical protein